MSRDGTTALQPRQQSDSVSQKKRKKMVKTATFIFYHKKKSLETLTETITEFSIFEKLNSRILWYSRKIINIHLKKPGTGFIKIRCTIFKIFL